MKYIYCSIVIIAFNSQLASAKEYKKVFDNAQGRLVEVCSTDADGTMNVLRGCVLSVERFLSLDIIGERQRKLKTSEVTEVTTPIYQDMKYKNKVFAMYKDSIVYLEYGLADGRSQIMIQRAGQSDEAKKYLLFDTFMVKTSDLDMEVEAVKGHKVGDSVCLKKSGQAMYITRLFSKSEVVGIDYKPRNRSSFFYDVDFTSQPDAILSDLVPCTAKPTLDPAQIVNTSAPSTNADPKINTQQSPKEVTSTTSGTINSPNESGAVSK